MKARTPFFAAVVLVALFAASCFVPHAQMVRDAQDAFSRGSEIENQTKIGLTSADGSGHYEVALGLVQQALRERPNQLVEDGLYGTALTIKALSLWRIDAQDSALVVAKRVEDGKDGDREFEVWPRDRAICTSLRYLVDIDNLGVTARMVTSATTSNELDADLMSHVDPVKEGLRTAAQPLSAKHPLRVYLTAAELELAYVVYTGLNEQAPVNRAKQHVQIYEALRDGALDRFQGLIDGADKGDQDRIGSLRAMKSDYESALLIIATPE